MTNDIFNKIKNQAEKLKIGEIGIISASDAEYQYKELLGLELNLQKHLPGCKTIISAVLPYNLSWNNTDNKSDGYIARYTTLNFYKMLFKKLKALAKNIKFLYGSIKTDKEYFKISVNSSLDDRFFSYITGLGFYSKNCCISVNNKGQRFILGEILLAEELNISRPETVNTDNILCKSCTKCIDICPTRALSEKKMNKQICLQELSSEKYWPENNENLDLIKIWGTRFFGCTECVDICPMNKNIIEDKYSSEEKIGFIGTNFDPKKILNLKKEEYKKIFSSNQLSAGWIPEVSLARNGLISLFNLKKNDLIDEYHKNILNYGWNDEEIELLKNFLEKLKK